MRRRDVRRVDDDRSTLSHPLDGRVDDCVSLRTVAKIDLAGDPDACSTQTIGIQKLCVIAVEFSTALLCRGVERIHACNSSK